MINVDGLNLTIDKALLVMEKGETAKLDQQAKKRVQVNREYLEKRLAGDEVIYGINTGFGHLSRISISPDESDSLQRNLLLSHAAGFGPDLEETAVRGVMLLRANALARGNSGIRPAVIEQIIDFLNHKIHPRIPAQGSVGASGDLAPLAHMSLALIGEGEVTFQGQFMPSREAMDKTGLKPLQLKAKEGLALINGTQVMAGLGILGLARGWRLMQQADVIAALSWEGLRGLGDAFDPLIQGARPHPGQKNVAQNLRKMIEGSENLTDNIEDKVQDAYTLRCIPQVHGASRAALEHLREILLCEINSATDNPLIFHEEDRIISGGNFHGQPLALPLDYAGMALAEIGNFSERRTERLVNPALSGLPPFLVENSGLNSGYMVVQYTAASLVSENKVLAGPASIDSIPTSANQEDHVSMGTIAARKMDQINSNLAGILAIEALCACQAVELAGISKLGRGTEKMYNYLREKIPHLNNDRQPSFEIQVVSELLKEGNILQILEEAGCGLE